MYRLTRIARASGTGKVAVGRTVTSLVLGTGLLGAGYYLGKADAASKARAKPDARACCSDLPLTSQEQSLQHSLVKELSQIVGAANVYENQIVKGTRVGKGTALAVVRPGNITEAVAVLKAAVAAGCAVVPQGANTGLTGGSVPRDNFDRPAVVISMKRVCNITPLGSGDDTKVLCEAGTGLFTLAGECSKIGRESHSVLGSYFLNPTVAAGICFGSGGTQIRKGPVYTERCLYCVVDDKGEVKIINDLGIEAPDGKIETLMKLIDEQKVTSAHVTTKAAALKASDHSYAASVCNLDGKVSRFNADTTGPWPNRSEGKVFVLASVHDTFPQPKKTQTLWIGCKDFNTAQLLKRDVCLNNPNDLPKSCEYMDRTTIEVTDETAGPSIKIIQLFGMARLEALWNIKNTVEALPLPFCDVLPDKVMYYAAKLFPTSIPVGIQPITKNYDHHLLMDACDFGNGELDRIRERLDAFVKAAPEGAVKVHECTTKEAAEAQLVRFSVAAAFMTWCVGKGAQGLALDYALPKNELHAPPMPKNYPAPLKRLRYSHFGCNVVHEDLAYADGVDVHEVKNAIKKEVEGLGGRLPAEHGHGTEYKAPADTQARWKSMDPTNTMNPGVGGLSPKKSYA